MGQNGIFLRIDSRTTLPADSAGATKSHPKFCALAENFAGKNLCVTKNLDSCRRSKSLSIESRHVLSGASGATPDVSSRHRTTRDA